MLNKKTILILSLVGLTVFVASLFPDRIGICNIVDTSCTRMFDGIGESLLVFIPLFLLSLITYKMRDEIYRAWIKFAIWWVSLSMILIGISPDYTNDLILPIVKGTVALAMSVVFTIISLFIIVWKYRTTKNK